MRLFIFSVVLTACATAPLKKEWNDKYDTAQWRKQFNECRKLLYTAYPEEVQRDEWSECMNKDYARSN